MKLAEALAERADVQTRLRILSDRLNRTVLVQEGDEPAENPIAIIREADALTKRLEWLIRAINHTNAVTPMANWPSEGAAQLSTITDAIAARDIAKRETQFFLSAAEAAAPEFGRYSRAEIRSIPTIPVKELRQRADAAAKRYRELDTRIQAMNWNVDLIEPAS